MTRLILIRHGETAWTRQKKYQGLTDIPLSASGRKQLRRLRKSFDRSKIDIFYSSALKRAVQTAAILTKGWKVPVIKDPRMNEFSFGAWEGKTARELMKAKDPSYLKWCRGRWVTPPGGESFRNFQKRTRGFLEQILKRHKDKTIAIVSHGGPLRMLVLHSLGLTSRFFWKFHFKPGSFMSLQINAGVARLEATGGWMNGASK